jgi:UDPglucose 6-dehydrogenase
VKETIGIVGQGFVGSAIRVGLENFFNIETYDLKAALGSCDSLAELVEKSNFIFVCLPTPMKPSGQCLTDIVDKTVTSIDNYCVSNKIFDRIVIIKSTVPPGTTDALNKITNNVSVIFSPEFLTEANSFDDFKNQSRIIVGGPRPASSKVKTMFRKAFPAIPIIKTSAKHAEMVKYFINCFLSTKVSFANEIYQFCEKMDIDYDKVIEYVHYDSRIGKSHLSVPGPDGDFGFGGHCFPKDLRAMKYLGKSLEIKTDILDAAWNKNEEVRKNRDWEKMMGRAIID